MDSFYSGIFYGDQVSGLINKEVGDGWIAGYRELRNSDIIQDEQDVKTEKGLIEVNYILTDKYLIKVQISELRGVNILKYERRKIVAIEKEYSFVKDWGLETMLDKIIIDFGYMKLELKRPLYKNNGDENGFEKLASFI